MGRGQRPGDQIALHWFCGMIMSELYGMVESMHWEEFSESYGSVLDDVMNDEGRASQS